MTGPTTAPATEASVSPVTRYWSRVNPPANGYAPGPWYRSPWAWEAVFLPDPIDYLLASFRTFGDVVCTRAVPFRSLFLAHPDHIKHVLQDNARNYVKGIVIAKLKVLIGDGLFTQRGRLLAPAAPARAARLPPRALAGFADDDDRRRRRRCSTGGRLARSAATPFDVSAEMSAPDARHRRAGAVQPGARRACGRRGARPHGRAGDRQRARHPLPAVTDLVADARPTGASAGRSPCSTGSSTTSSRRAGARQRSRDDLLAMLLLARDEETGEGMTDRQLRDEVMTFLLAGTRDHRRRAHLDLVPARPPPGVAERLRAEVAAALGDAHADRRRPAAPAATRAWSSRRRCASTRRCGDSRGRRSTRTESAASDPEALGRDDLALRHPPAPGLLARSGALRPGALHPGAGPRAGRASHTCPSAGGRGSASATSSRSWKHSSSSR